MRLRRLRERGSLPCDSAAGSSRSHDQTGRIHHDGQIWSRALYDIHNALGRETADTIILQAQFDFGVDPSFAEAAEAPVDAAEAIAGTGAALKVQKAFEDRGIL